MVESQPFQPLPQLSRDDPPPDANATNDNFVELWTDALERYKEKTGVDIQNRKNEFVQLFDDCKDSADALAVLDGLPVFKKPIARDSWRKIKGSLKKVLDVVIVLNTLAAEVGNVVCQCFAKICIFCLTNEFERPSQVLGK